jgi:hypothetical protein
MDLVLVLFFLQIITLVALGGVSLYCIRVRHQSMVVKG